MSIEFPKELRKADRVIATGIRGLNHQVKPAGMYLETESPERIAEWAEAYIRDINTTAAWVVPDSWKEQNPEAARLIQHIVSQRYHHARINHASVREMSALMGRHFVMNLPRLATAPTIDRFADTLRGKPAIVVSAGPSLDKNRHLLEEAYGKAAIFAVNTSAKAIPGPIDAIVSVEHKEVRELFEARAGQCAHFLDLTANPTSWEVPHKGQVAMVNLNPPLMAYMEMLGVCPISFRGGVAGAALSAVHFMGADPIILVGQDLAWTDGRCYASGSPFDDLTLERDGDRIKHSGESKEIFDSWALEVPAWGGSTVLSTHIWEGFRQWFAQSSQQISAAGGTVYNCTEGGSRIDGTVERTLREVLDELGPIERPDFSAEGSWAFKYVVARLYREANRLVKCPFEELAQAVDDSLISHMWVVPALLEMGEQCGLSVMDRVNWLEKAQRQAGHDVLELLREMDRRAGYVE